MKTFVPVVVVVFLLFLFSRCSSVKKIEALKPSASNASEVVFKNTTSIINMPISIPLSEIEAQLNNQLQGLIYQDTILDDDNTAIKIWKQAPIKLKEVNGKLESQVPLKIWAKIKYGSDFLKLTDTREINLDGIITTLSDVQFSNWSLQTQSKILNIDWNESPTISVAGKNVAITYLINPSISIFKSKIAKKIDEAIGKSANFKPHVLAVLETLSKPIQTSETFDTWLKVVPIELYSTNAKLNNQTVTLETGLKCSMQTMVGQKPLNTFKKESVIFKNVTKIQEQFEATVAAISTYEGASRILTKNFQGQTFSAGKRSITIQDVALWHKDGKMIIALTTNGSVTGTIYLTGIPNYNNITKEIYFDQMDYVLNTKGVLTKTANWLLSGLILKKIQESCRYSIKSNLEDGKKNLQPYLNNYSPIKGVFVNGQLNNFDFDKIELSNNAIIAFVKASGVMKIKIEGME